jgi:hypothetical protein
MAEAKETAKFTEEHPVLSGLSYPFKGLVGGVAGNIEVLKQNASNAFTGKNVPVNIYDKNFKQIRARNVISEELTRDKGIVPKLLIQTGLSMGDMAVALPFGAAAAPIILSSNAAADAAYDATERGATAGQALASGIAAGAAEYFTERLSIENLFKIAKMPKSAIKKYALNIAKQAHLEGSEEFITQVINNIADDLIMGGNSNFNRRVNEYIKNGSSSADAQNKAFIDLYVKDTAMAYAGGAISGAFFGAAGSGYSAANGDVDAGTPSGTPSATPPVGKADSPLNTPSVSSADTSLGEGGYTEGKTGGYTGAYVH